MKYIIVACLFLTGCATVDPCIENGGKRQGAMVGGSGVSVCVFK